MRIKGRWKRSRR